MKLGILAWALAMLLLIVGMAVRILQGGWFNYLWAAVMATPLIALVFLNYRRHWHVVIFIALAMGRIRLPFPALEKLSPLMIVSMLVIALRTLDYLMTKQGGWGASWIDRAGKALALILTLRFVVDRPGFVALGAAEGGFFLSIEYVLGAWMFVVLPAVTASAKFTRLQLRVCFGCVLAFLLFALYRSHIGPFRMATRAFGEQETWMLASLVFALDMSARSEGSSLFGYFVKSMFFAFMAIFSAYRARAFYILGSALSVAHAARRFRKTALVLMLITVLGFGGIIAYHHKLPVAITRFASVFVRVNRRVEGVGAYGAMDEFRVELLKLAWEHIRGKPLIGRGFGVNVAEALRILAVSSDRQFLEMIALGGAYHNSIVALAVIAGLPAAGLFTIILVAVPFRFQRIARTIPSNDFRTWMYAVSGFYAALMFMLMLNGGPREFMMAMVLTGFMQGMMRHGAVRSLLMNDTVTS